MWINWSNGLSLQLNSFYDGNNLFKVQIDLPQVYFQKATADTESSQKSVCWTQAKSGVEIDLLGLHGHEY